MKYIVTIYCAHGQEYKATVNTWDSVELFMSKYEWQRVIIVKRYDL